MNVGLLEEEEERVKWKLCPLMNSVRTVNMINHA